MTKTATLEVIREMCLYWDLARDHENKTILLFRKLIRSIEVEPLTVVNPGDLINLFYRIREESHGTDLTVRRQFDYVRRVFKYAQARGYLRQNPCELIKLPKCRRAQIVSLTLEQLNLVEQAEITAAAVRKLNLPLVKYPDRTARSAERARDFFLFQCYTGLAVSDMSLFNRSSILVIDGEKWLYGHRKKTGSEFVLPFDARAEALADKYDYNFYICEAFYNRLLKVIQKIAAVETVLTTHVGRRTFGQLALDSGVSLETVSKMLGHSSIAVTERHYARVSVMRVIRDMQGRRLAA